MTVDARFERLPIDRLRPHEEVDEEALEEVIEALRREIGLSVPIVVDRRTLVILDGHHRHAAYRALGMKEIPCVLVDYDSPRIRVEARRPGIVVSKAEVIRRGLSGQLYPPKTTRHLFPDELRRAT